MDLANGLLRTCRPKQWVKNVLVFAAPAAAGTLFHGVTLLHALVAFISFCLASSGTYVLNDLADVEADRVHPTKRNRPIAAGIVSPLAGAVTGVVLLVAAIAVGFATTHWQFCVVVAGYILLTTAYSRWLKHVAVLDIMAVAFGFLLRAIGGASATHTPLSNWFLLVATFGSLFMVVGKRHAEHRVSLASPDQHVRAVLAHYTDSYLQYLRAVASSGVLVSYCLFAFERAQLHDGRFPWFQLSIAPFAAGILRYALLLEAGQGENPEDVVLSDRALLATGLCWVATFMLGTYYGG